VAANDLSTSENLAYLLRCDTVYRRYEKDGRSNRQWKSQRRWPPAGAVPQATARAPAARQRG